MLAVAVAAVALPMEQQEAPALTPASSASVGRPRTEQQGGMRDLWEKAATQVREAKAAEGFSSEALNMATAEELKRQKSCLGREHSSRCRTGTGTGTSFNAAAVSAHAAQVRTADAFAAPRGDFGSVTLVVNQTGQCGHPVPLDTKVATSPSINRHKYNANKFGANAAQSGYAEFLGPHQTAEWFGVSPATWTNRKVKDGHDAVQVRVASITLDTALYIDSLDIAGLPMPNGAYYPQMSDPKGYPRPMYLAPHGGALNLTITEGCGTKTSHLVALNGTSWENGQPGNWRRLKIGKQVKSIKFTGGRDSTWAVKNFCGAAPWQERLLQSAKSEIVLMTEAPSQLLDTAVVTNGMVLRAAVPAAVARRRASVVCESTLEKVNGEERACVDPCTSSWDDWCEQTNNEGKACGASPDDEPCLSKTCKCTEVRKVVAAPRAPLEKQDCASKTYVVRTDTPVDPTMTWLNDPWCQSYCSTPDGCPDDVADLCGCDSEEDQVSEPASAAEKEQKQMAAMADAAKDAEMAGKAAEQKVHDAEGAVGSAPAAGAGAVSDAEKRQKEKEFEQKVKEDEQIRNIEEGGTAQVHVRNGDNDEALFCSSGYASKDETASDLWCANACEASGCAKDAQGVCECADGTHGCDQRLTPGCGVKTPVPNPNKPPKDDLLEPIDGSYEETVACLSISADKSDDWCNYACRVSGSTRQTNSEGCPPHAQKDCKCGADANAEVRLLARVAAAARARTEEQADAS
jgi:hypothetical protein